MRTPNDHRADALLARLIRLTSRREDFLTECFAAVLQADPRAARRYWRQLASGLPSAVRTATGPITVRTQIPAGRGSSRLDMVVSNGGYRIAVEHKIFAPQGEGQLPKYVALPRADVSHVALVTGDYQRVADRVLSSRRYVRPRGNKGHFLWSDFYDLLKGSSNRGFEVAAATRGLFDRLGLQPAHPLIGDLRTADRERRMKYDSRLYHAWRPLLSILRRRWQYADSSIRKDSRSQIYISFGPSDLLREVWLDPLSSPSSLRIRLKTNTPAKRARMLVRLQRSTEFRPGGRITADPVRLAPSRRGNHWAIELRVPWALLLARTPTRDRLGPVLKRFVLGLMRTVDRGAV